MPYFKGGKWAEPSVTDLEKVLRQLSKSTKEGKRKARIAKTNVLENFMCTKITALMRDKLDAIVLNQKNKK